MWDDCKIAFRIHGRVDAEGDTLIWLYSSEFPYELIEVDSSCAQSFAIFRVEGVPCIEKASEIRDLIKKHNL